MSQYRKWYAAVIDYAPTEQLLGYPDRVVTQGMVMALTDAHAFDRVGELAPQGVKQMTLRPWSRRPLSYKLAFVEHLAELIETDTIMCGCYHSDEALIRRIGKSFTRQFTGDLEKSDDLNRHGKKRMTLGLRHGDGTSFEAKILVDEIYVLGWVAESFETHLGMLDNINGEQVGLTYLLDQLPTEKGGDVLLKANVLNWMLHTKHGDRIRMGVHEKGTSNARDLLADNVAGLASDIFHQPLSELAKANTAHGNLFRFTRDNRTGNTLTFKLVDK